VTHYVPLRELPEGLKFPRELQDRIHFHRDKQLLQFDGFMSKTDYDRLLRVHNDLAYQRALEELFHKCTFAEVPVATQAHGVRRRAMPWFVVAAAAIIAVISITVLGIRAL
jgi:hypothetical protein